MHRNQLIKFKTPKRYGIIKKNCPKIQRFLEKDRRVCKEIRGNHSSILFRDRKGKSHVKDTKNWQWIEIVIICQDSWTIIIAQTGKVKDKWVQGTWIKL